MVWVIVAISVLVLGAGVWVARGRGGEMPQNATRRPQPRMPQGEWTAEDVRQLSFASVGKGYGPRAVDALLDDIARGLEGLAGSVSGDRIRNSRFSLELGGYDMAQVDVVLEQLTVQLDAEQTSDETPITSRGLTDPTPDAAE